MIDPNNYWVNKSMDPMFKAMMYDRDVWAAKQDGMDIAIDIFDKATRHNGKTHYYGMECWFCDTVEKIRDSDLDDE